MPATHALINLLGEIALLLWGIHMVHSGVLRAYGAELRGILAVGLKDRMRALAAGLGVTLALQSSTATALMASSFVAGGVVGLAPALAVMLGANIGTSLIVQVLSFDVTLVFPILIFVGVFAFRSSRAGRARSIGRIAIGLGLMLLSLHLLVETMKPVEEAQAMRDLFHALTGDPLINIAVAALFTAATHSSVAALLFIMSLAGAGVIAPEASLAMVLGANLGSAVNPLLEGLGGEPASRRAPAGNLLNRLIGCVIAVPLLGPSVDFLMRIESDPSRLAANFHMLFNMAAAALFLLPLPLIARLLERAFPERARPGDPGEPLYLDRNALETPSVALANASRETLRMVDVVEAMLRGCKEAIHGGDRKLVQDVSRMDDILDRLNKAIQRYLAAIDREALSEDDARRLTEILTFSINLEHIGDIIDRNLIELAARRMKLRLRLAPEGLDELDEMQTRLLGCLQLATAVFMSGDVGAARRLVTEKDAFRQLERSMTRRHFSRLQDGQAESLETSGLQLDIARDLKRIEAHIVAAAYPVLEETGQLKPTRLARDVSASRS